MAEFQKDPAEIGALWAKSGSKGEYLSGVINGVNVVCFRNTKGTSDKAPTWRVLKSKPREERPAPVEQPQDDFRGDW